MTATWTARRAHGFDPHAPGRQRRSGERTRFPEQSALCTPPGWPAEVRPPHAPDWQDSAVAFLLDACPPEYRGYPVLRRHPVVLARFAAEHVESQVVACREGLSGARAGLGDVVDPEVVEAATLAWQQQAALVGRRRREVALVEEALRGKVFLRKL